MLSPKERLAKLLLRIKSNQVLMEQIAQIVNSTDERFVEASLPEPYGGIEVKFKASVQLWGNEGIFEIFVSNQDWSEQTLYIVQTQVDKTRKILLMRDEGDKLVQLGETIYNRSDNEKFVVIAETGEVVLQSKNNRWIVVLDHEDKPSLVQFWKDNKPVTDW